MVKRQSQQHPQNQNDNESGESSGEEYICSQNGSRREMSSDERSRMGGVIAHYLLCSEIKKIPAKRPELVKLLSKEQQKHINILIKEAKTILKRVYGFELIELDKKNYILCNKLIKQWEENPESDDTMLSMLHQDCEKKGLLCTILSVIFMNGGTIQEATLASFLSKLGLEMESKTSDSVFGTLSRVLQEFNRQQYITIDTIKAVDPPIKEYKWGERAKYECSKKSILQMVCKIYGGNMSPKMWNEQWKEAQKN